MDYRKRACNLGRAAARRAAMTSFIGVASLMPMLALGALSHALQQSAAAQTAMAAMGLAVYIVAFMAFQASTDSKVNLLIRALWRLSAPGARMTTSEAAFLATSAERSLLLLVDANALGVGLQGVAGALVVVAGEGAGPESLRLAGIVSGAVAGFALFLLWMGRRRIAMFREHAMVMRTAAEMYPGEMVVAKMVDMKEKEGR